MKYQILTTSYINGGLDAEINELADEGWMMIGPVQIAMAGMSKILVATMYLPEGGEAQ